MDNFIYAVNSFNNVLTKTHPAEKELSELLRARGSDNAFISKVVDYISSFYHSHLEHISWLFETSLLKELVNGFKLLSVKHNAPTIAKLGVFFVYLHSHLDVEKHVLIFKDYQLGKRLWSEISKVETPYPVYTQLLDLYASVELVPGPLFPVVVAFVQDHILKLMTKNTVFTRSGDIARLVFGFAFLNTLFENSANYNVDTIRVCEEVCSSALNLIKPLTLGLANFKQNLVFQNNEMVLGALRFYTTVFKQGQAPYAITLLNTELKFSRVLLEFMIAYSYLDKYVVYQASRLTNVYLKANHHTRVYDFNYDQAVEFAVGCLRIGQKEVESKFFDLALVPVFLSNYVLLYEGARISKPFVTLETEDMKQAAGLIESYVSIALDTLSPKDVRLLFSVVKYLLKENNLTESLRLLKACATISRSQDPEVCGIVTDFFLEYDLTSNDGYELIVSGLFDTFLKNVLQRLEKELENTTKSLSQPTFRNITLFETIIRSCTIRGRLCALDPVLAQIHQLDLVEPVVAQLGLISDLDLDIVVKLLMELPVDSNLGDTYITKVLVIGNSKVKRKVLLIVNKAIESSHSLDFLLSQEEFLGEVLNTGLSSDDAEYKALCYRFLQAVFSNISAARADQLFQLFMKIDVLGFVVMPALDDEQLVLSALSILKTLVSSSSTHEYVKLSGALRSVISSFKEHRWYSGPIFNILYRLHLPQSQVSLENLEYLVSIEFFSMLSTFYDMIRQVVTMAEESPRHELKSLEKPILRFYLIMRSMVWASPEYKKMLAYNHNTEFNYLSYIVLQYSDFGDYDQSTKELVLTTHLETVGDKEVLIGDQLMDLHTLV